LNGHFPKIGESGSSDQNTANNCLKLYNLKLFYAFKKFQTLVYIELCGTVQIFSTQARSQRWPRRQRNEKKIIKIDRIEIKKVLQL
jgi:hypothetical protein